MSKTHDHITKKAYELVEIIKLRTLAEKMIADGRLGGNGRHDFLSEILRDEHRLKTELTELRLRSQKTRKKRKG